MATLPAKLAEVFRLLRSGKHICREDVNEYRDLERNEDVYRVLFNGLGYELVHHGQGFYYFKGGNTLSTQRLQGITLFVLILFQDLDDRKFQDSNRSWERKLLARDFRVSELPHFQTPNRRNLLYNLGVTPDSLQEKVLRPMARYGMLVLSGSDSFRFRPPIYRFVDLCMQFAEQNWAIGPEGANASASITVLPDEDASAVDVAESIEDELEEES